MTTTVATSAAELLERAGVAAVRALPLAESVNPVAGVISAEFAGAVVVPFSGSATGELALLIDEQVIANLPPGVVGSQGLAAALGPAIDAIMSAVGTLQPGIAQVLDPRVATTRADAHADSATLSFTGATGVRAVLAIGLDPVSGDALPAQRAFAPDRLDLLRGVEMQASAELGRARMTINDLLSLRTGAVIELDRAAGDPADLFVNGRLIARGEVVVVDENYALRITQIVSEEGGR